MTDPMNALLNFQQEFPVLKPKLKPARTDRKLHLYVDAPNGEIRVTFVRLEGKTVTALVSFAENDPIDGVHCYDIGYAVAEAYRRQGRAKEIAAAAIRELQANGEAFYVNAIVEADNVASQRVAAQVISATAIPINESITGLPAFRYLGRFEPK